MPEGIKSTLVYCEGGLDLTQDILMKSPGFAVNMINFEPGITGGYRRISGYQKYSSTAVTGQGSILGIFVFNSGVVAVRPTLADATKADVYFGTGSSWTKINSDVRSTPTQVYFTRYNWNGTERIMMTDGVNDAAKWDGTTWTAITAATAPTNPQFCIEHKGYMVFAGYTSGAGIGAIAISEPLDDSTWGAGAIELVVGDDITGITSFRDELIIFSRRSIHKLVGSSSTDFALQQITRNIGCVAGHSIQEVNGDIVFLAPDGIRTLAATQRIGDFELGSISHSIKSLLSGINADAFNINSLTVKAKNQYRLFYIQDTDTDTSAKGVIGGLRINRQQSLQWEWGELLGIRPYCCDSSYVNSLEVVVHGGYDGFVYQQELGTSLNGSDIFATFKSPEFIFDDGGTRKVIHRVIVYAKSEGSSSVGLTVYFDHNSTSVQQPLQYTITGVGGTVYTFDALTTIFDDVAVFDQVGGNNQYRQNVAGSGFQAAFQFSSNDISAPYTILGYAIEYSVKGRR